MCLCVHVRLSVYLFAYVLNMYLYVYIKKTKLYVVISNCACIEEDLNCIVENKWNERGVRRRREIFVDVLSGKKRQEMQMLRT